MGRLRVEIVARAVKIHRQEIDALQPILLPISLEHYQQGFLGDRIGGVGLFGVAGPKILFAEGDGGELRIGADCAHLDELLQAVLPRVLDQVQAHGHIVVEEPAGVGAIGADPAHLRRHVDHHRGVELPVHPRDRRPRA